METERHIVSLEPQPAAFFPAEQIWHQMDFLSQSECETLRKDVLGSFQKPKALITSSDPEPQYDLAVRKTQQAFVSNSSQIFVTRRLMALRQELAEHFKVKLMACQPPQFLVYRPGDFFLVHSDVLPDTQRISWRRTLTAVLFLNSPDHAELPYTGGELVLYAFSESERLDGYPVQIHAGQLVVFPAGLLHEVLPVKSGVRQTVISWYYG